MVHEFGPPSVLVPAEAPEPQLAPGQVLIEVELVNVTFVETQVRAGRPPNPAMLPQLPAIPGNGVGGRVIAVGEGVNDALVGARVVSSTGGSGAYAELAAVDAAGVIEVPAQLELADAVALLADGRTAMGLVRSAGVREGDIVLVEAAAGGVGSLLVQLCRNAGALVVAAAGGRAKLDVAARLGPALTVDYTQPGWTESVRGQVGGVDVVFDGVGGEIGREAFGLVRDGGRFSVFGLASGSFTEIPDGQAARAGISVIRGSRVAPGEMLELTRAALAEAAAGRLRALVGQTFPLDRAADAHAAIEARATVGKTLLLTR